MEMVEHAYKVLREERVIYTGNRFKKYLCLFLGVFLGLVLSYPTVNIVSTLSSALYDRRGLDGQLEKRFSDRTFNDLAVDELLISAYDFNSQQPRFYSKYFLHHNTGNYDVKLREAMGGSGAAPIYFDPQTLMNKFGINEVVVDGGIICNNPSMYAYMLAKYLKGKKDLRVISLGTGRDLEHIQQ